MQFKPMHPNFILPTKASDGAGALDLYMPEAGSVSQSHGKTVNLGFAAAIPPGYVGLLLPRSSSGAKYGLELKNTCGVIDSDYRGEWKAVLKTKENTTFSWDADDRVIQLLVVPVLEVFPELVDELPQTKRGAGGFGSTGT